MFTRINDLPVRTKVLGLIAIVIIGLVVFGVVSWDTLNTAKVNGPVYERIVENKDLVADILPPPEYLVESYLNVFQMLGESDKTTLDALVQRSVQLRKDYEDRHQHWEKTLPAGQLKDTMVVQSYRSAIQFLDLRDKEFIPAVLKGDLESARALAQGGLKQRYEEHRASIDRVVVLALQKTDADERSAQTTIDSRMMIQLLVAFIVVLISLVNGFLLARYIATTVQEYASFAGHVAQGDLTARLQPRSNDELGALGRHLNSMVQSLKELSGQISESAQNITAAATQILATVSEHTASASEQSAAVNEITATVEEVRVSAEQSARQAEDVSRRAQTSLRASQEGLAAVQAILTGMQDIRGKVQAIAQDILALSDRTQQIGEITATVNDIADQSNLLALNAAIEAAKAGEQGKGFAVVASEVRRLAEQSKQATGRVHSILSDIQKGTNAAVMATEQGTHGVEAGLELTQHAGHVIEELERASEGSAQAAQQISAAVIQQREAITQTVQAMKEISLATAQFLTGARQSQQAAESLNNRAQQLQMMTQRYKIAA
jgi:methyl-accepting chemotaxis protein